MLTLAGVNDENLTELMRQTGARVALRGDTMTLSGSRDEVERAQPVAQRMIDAAKQQLPLKLASGSARQSGRRMRSGTPTGQITLSRESHDMNTCDEQPPSLRARARSDTHIAACVVLCVCACVWLCAVTPIRPAQAMRVRTCPSITNAITRLLMMACMAARKCDRMRMLAALKSVDWVVPFSEDTPARLIGRVLPDLLVKGGDYTAEQVAGYDAVTANGGQVAILEFHNGYSTTRLIERARAKSG